MFSSINLLMRRCCHDQGEVVNKADYFSQYLPWVDLVLGIILCTIAIVASYGYIPLSSAGLTWLQCVAAAEVILSIFIMAEGCLMQCYHMTMKAVDERSMNVFRELFSQEEHTQMVFNESE